MTYDDAYIPGKVSPVATVVRYFCEDCGEHLETEARLIHERRTDSFVWERVKRHVCGQPLDVQCTAHTVGFIDAPPTQCCYCRAPVEVESETTTTKLGEGPDGNPERKEFRIKPHRFVPCLD